MSRFKLKTRFKISVVLLALIVVFSIGGGLGYAFFFGGTSVNLNKGLIGYWDFGAGSTTTLTPDRTPNNNDGNVTGATISGITDRKGRSDKAYSFDGTDYISVNDADILDAGTGDFSYSLWFNGTVTGTPVLLRKFVAANGGYQLILSGSKIYMRFSEGTDDGVGDVETQGATALSASTWYFVAVTHDRDGNMVGYLNGVSDASASIAAAESSANNAANLFIGAQDTTPNNPFTGTIDDVRLYNRLLSPTEVTALYESYNPGVVISDLQKGLVGHWKFDSVAKDATPNGNHGTLNGNAAVTASDRKGQPNKALAVDGTGDYLEMLDSTALRPASVTVSAWANMTGPGTNQTIVTKTYSDTRHSYDLRTYNGNIEFQILNTDGATEHIASKTAPAFSTWFHVVGTYDGSTVNIYVDGVIGTPASISTTIAYAARTAQIGAGYYNGVTALTTGSIDDVRIYNRALSATEVTALYQSYSPGAVVSDLQKGLVGYWDFGAGSTTTATPDRTPNNNDGAVTGATLAADRKGQSSKAYTFNGTSDKITITHNAVFNVSSITVSAWIKPTTLTGSSSIVNKRYSGGGARTWELIYDVNGKLYFFISTDSQTNLLEDAATANGAIVAGNWYHVVGTYSGGVATLYVNGVSSGTDTGGGTLDTNALDILIASNYSTPDYSDGIIDDVRVYNRALSPTEVLALYESYR